MLHYIQINRVDVIRLMHPPHPKRGHYFKGAGHLCGDSLQLEIGLAVSLVGYTGMLVRS